MRRTVAAASVAALLGLTVAAGPGYAAEDVHVHDIQGAAHVSPLAGEDVADVPGVVTAVADDQFFLQDPQPDTDPATAEGLLVYTGAAPGVAVGHAVTVTGKVTEYRPGGAATNLSTTEIVSAPDQVDVASSGNPLPAATVAGSDGRVPPNQVITEGVDGDVEESDVFAPAKHGLDFWESLEGMRVQVDDALAVAPTNRFGELAVVGDDGAHAKPRSTSGGVVQTAADGNPERLILRGAFAKVPTADVGDVLPGAVTGVLDYNFGNYTLEIDETPDVRSGDLDREVTDPQRRNELSVASFNVENLDPADPAAKFAGLAETVVRNLRAPDILTVEEIQDDTGPTDDGTVTADATVDKLTAAIEDAGGPAYAWQSIDPENNADGGEPGGNIRVGFLYRTDCGIEFADAPRGDATTPVGVEAADGGARLTHNPGRIEPNGDAWDETRKPVAGQFTWRGETVFVVANHWSSKGGDDPLMGRYQPPRLASEEQRVAQARSVAGFVEELTAVDPKAHVVVAGDLNDFPWSPPITEATDLVDLPQLLPKAGRFTYNYQGNSEVLDHILLSRSLTKRGFRYDVVHTNADFADQLSDHDPQVVRLELTAGR
ncbi:MAG: nuclease [Streptosporangiales bacterium]|nr:nuclease [Streptosporangiales bacterium]